MRISNGWIDEAIQIDYSAKSMPRAQLKPSHIVLHGTAGGSSAQGIANYFATSPVLASAHIIIDQAGTIVQGISMDMAAWGNGILDNPRLDLPTSINPNLYTVSIEHVKASTDNSDQLTDAQKQASFRVVQTICEYYGIPKRRGDNFGGIIEHADLDSVTRARCPGPYPWLELIAFLLKGDRAMIPTGWRDDGATLTAPNGVSVVKGFRQYILDRGWDAGNFPLAAEEARNQIERSNPGLGAGSLQTFKWKRLEWTKERGVFESYVGQELFVVEHLLDQYTGASNISQAADALRAIIAAAKNAQDDCSAIQAGAQNAIAALGK